MASRAEDFGWLTVLFVLGLCAVPVAAQSGREFEGRFPFERSIDSELTTALKGSGVPATADAVIEEMAQAAGVIFAGQVLAVRRPLGFAGSGVDAAEEFVEVDFRVEQAVRGPVAGSVYTLREWSGLWSASGCKERYRVGQRLLVFLYEPDAQGLSSPVHGRDGAVPLRGGGLAPGPDDATVAAANWLVDLRWVQTRALRRNALALLPVPRPVYPGPIHGSMPESDGGRTALESDRNFVRGVPVPVTSPTEAAIETEPLAQVLALCQQAMRPADAGR